MSAGPSNQRSARPLASLNRLGLAAAILLAVVSVSRQAGAGPNEDAAREAFEQARRAHNLGHWQEAADGYERAYRLHPDPALLYDRAVALKNAGRLSDALANFRAFLREQPDTPNRPAVEARIREIEEALRASPPSNPSPVQTTTAPGVTMRPNADTEPPPANAGRWLPWVGVATTAALAGGAVVSGLMTNSRLSELRSSCGQTTAGCTDAQIAGVSSKARITNILWVITSVAGAATGVAFYLGRGKEAGVSVATRF